MNALNNFDKTDREYSSALLMTWLDYGGQRSRSQQAVEMGKVSTSTLRRQSPYSSFYWN